MNIWKNLDMYILMNRFNLLRKKIYKNKFYIYIFNVFKLFFKQRKYFNDLGCYN